MIESLSKNLWLLLTLVIPGFFTYGMWRILLFLEPCSKLNMTDLAAIENSAIVLSSIIISIALFQQAIAIAIEAIVTCYVKSRKTKYPKLYTLFYERFALAASGKLDQNATRIIGNFFLSINMFVGLVLLIVYYLTYESLRFDHWVPIFISVLLVATLVTVYFRMHNAIWAIEVCKNKPDKEMKAPPRFRMVKNCLYQHHEG